MFSNYTFSNSNFFINFFTNFFLKFFKYLFIYLLEFKISYSDNLTHPSTLNSKARLVNPRDISVVYPSLKVRVKRLV